MKRTVLLGLASSFLLCGLAIACDIITSIPAPLVNISPYTTLRQKYEKIAEEVDKVYGSTFQDKLVYQLRVPVKVCLLGICGTSIETNFYKPCGQTFKQAILDVSMSGPGGAGGGTGGGGGMGGGEGGPGGGGGMAGEAPEANPFRMCSDLTIRSCMNGVCRVDTYAGLDCPIILG